MSKRRRSRKKTQGTEPAIKPITIVTQHRAFLPGLALLAILFAWITFDARLSLIGDNAEFITLGRSIAQGHGLTYINTVEALPATKYPFGFPLVLAVIHLIFPFSLPAMKIFVAATFILSIPTIYVVVARLISPGYALASAGFTLISIYALNFGSIVLSEVPYMLLSLVAIWRVHLASEKDDLRSHGLAILSLMAAYYVRSIGISLVAATVVYLFLKEKRKWAGIYAIVCVLLALPWQIRTQLAGGPSYVRTWLLSADPYTLQGTLGFSGLLNRIAQNLYLYATKELPRVFWPSHYDLQYAGGPLDAGWVSGVLGMALALGVLVFVVRGLRDRQLLALYLLFYAGVCMLWPEVWASVRLLIPVIPLLVPGVLHSLGSLVTRLAGGNRWSGVIALVFAGLYAFSNGSAIARHVDYVTRQPPAFENYLAAGDWIKRNTPEDAVICCRKAYLMFVASNRRTTSYLFTNDHTSLLQDLEEKQVDHVVVDHLSSSTGRYLVPAINANRGRFESLHIVPKPDTYVLKFK